MGPKISPEVDPEASPTRRPFALGLAPVLALLVLLTSAASMWWWRGADDRAFDKTLTELEAVPGVRSVEVEEWGTTDVTLAPDPARRVVTRVELAADTTQRDLERVHDLLADAGTGELSMVRLDVGDLTFDSTYRYLDEALPTLSALSPNVESDLPMEVRVLTSAVIVELRIGPDDPVARSVPEVVAVLETLQRDGIPEGLGYIWSQPARTPSSNSLDIYLDPELDFNAAIAAVRRLESGTPGAEFECNNVGCTYLPTP